jgi:hypothetical protein
MHNDLVRNLLLKICTQNFHFYFFLPTHMILNFRYKRFTKWVRRLHFFLFTGFMSFSRCWERYSYNYTTYGLCAPEKSYQGTAGIFAYEFWYVKYTYSVIWFSIVILHALLTMYVCVCLCVYLCAHVEMIVGAFVLSKSLINNNIFFCYICHDPISGHDRRTGHHYLTLYLAWQA